MFCLSDICVKCARVIYVSNNVKLLQELFTGWLFVCMWSRFCLQRTAFVGVNLMMRSLLCAGARFDTGVYWGLAPAGKIKNQKPPKNKPKFPTSPSVPTCWPCLAKFDKLSHGLRMCVWRHCWSCRDRDVDRCCRWYMKAPLSLVSVMRSSVGNEQVWR